MFLVLNRSDGCEIAWNPAHPALLLLHGFPSSSYMVRDLIPHLADRFHLVAPDLPGFGHTSSPADFAYTFDNLTGVVQGFTDALGLGRYALYVFDYGAPVGFRLALARPDRVTAIVSQNGNAYEEGKSGNWDPIQRYWREPTPGNRDALRSLLTLDATKWQSLHGVPDLSLVSPDGYTLDHTLLSRPGTGCFRVTRQRVRRVQRSPSTGLTRAEGDSPTTIPPRAGRGVRSGIVPFGLPAKRG